MGSYNSSVESWYSISAKIYNGIKLAWGSTFTPIVYFSRAWMSFFDREIKILQNPLLKDWTVAEIML